MLHRRHKAAIICAFLSLAGSAALAAEAVTERLPIGLPQLIEIKADGVRAHEAVPLGVPRGYDWASRARVGAGNDPGPFTAITGWGQVFWAEGAGANGSLVQIRNFQVLLCHGPQREWTLLQRGDIEGRQFGADFRNNANQPAALFHRQAGVAAIAFAPGSSFHFWPRHGRASLPDRDLCGVVVLLQARAASPSADSGAAPAPGTYLIGLGADYWIDQTVGWDSYKTNKDIAIGRLKLLGPEWAWYGLSTASDADLQRLHQGGYKVRISANPS
jgi:hypothetical protein